MRKSANPLQRNGFAREKTLKRAFVAISCVLAISMVVRLGLSWRASNLVYRPR